MSRKRLVSPQFFTHSGLFDAEHDSGLPLRLAFAGLWTACDRRGIFEWKPRVLKLQILPYDTVDFDAILGALRGAGFVEYYVVGGKEFGRIPSFDRWQTFHKNEKPSDAPSPPVGVSEPSNDGPESSNGRRSTPVVIAVAGTGSSTVADAVAVGSDATSSSSPADQQTKPQQPATQPSGDIVTAFVSAHDFGPFAGPVAGLIRSSRNADAVIATLRMHLAGEMGHEKGTARELGLAAQHFVANGHEFAAHHFAGYLVKAKKGAERVDNRKRNANEDRAIASEERARANAAAEDREADALLESFAKTNPERYRELVKSANAALPMNITSGREPIIRGAVLRAIRLERPKAGAA